MIGSLLPRSINKRRELDFWNANSIQRKPRQKEMDLYKRSSHMSTIGKKNVETNNNARNDQEANNWGTNSVGIFVIDSWMEGIKRRAAKNFGGEFKNNCWRMQDNTNPARAQQNKGTKPMGILSRTNKTAKKYIH